MAESIDSVVDSFSIALKKNNKQNDCPATFHKLFLKLKKRINVNNMKWLQNLRFQIYLCWPTFTNQHVWENWETVLSCMGGYLETKRRVEKSSNGHFFWKAFCAATTLKSDSGTFNNIRCQQDCFTEYRLNKLEFPKQTLSQRSSLKGSG